MRRLPYLPNLLSSLRIALAPAMLGAAYSNSKTGFIVLLIVLLIADGLDGALARWWKAESVLGRRLDRWGDGLTMVLAAIGVFFLWPQPVEREWVWSLAALTGYALIGLQRLIVSPEGGPQSRWWCKVLACAVPLSLVPLLQQWTPWPFRAAAVLEAVMGLTRFIAAWARRTKEPDGEVPGVKVPAIPPAGDIAPTQP